MIVNRYRARLKHDNGYFYITVVASDEETAIDMIMRAEHCPRGAIQSITVQN